MNKYHKNFINAATGVVILLTITSAFGQKQPTIDEQELKSFLGVDEAERMDQLKLYEILQTAPPAPMPKEPFPGSKGAVGAGVQDKGVTAFDPATGNQTVTPGTAFPEMPVNGGDAPLTMPEQQGLEPQPVSNQLNPGYRSLESTIEGVESVSSGETPAGHGTPPIPTTSTLGFPYRTVVKLLMRFNVSGVNYFYVCSGSTRDQYMVWTAGHCLYNHDPNDDGSTADARWASEVWIYPAQTDRVYISGLGFRMRQTGHTVWQKQPCFALILPG